MATKAHTTTDNTHLPKEGVKARYSSIRGHIKNGGIFYKVNIKGVEDTIHVSKSNFGNPPNFRKVFKRAIEKSDLE